MSLLFFKVLLFVDILLGSLGQLLLKSGMKNNQISFSLKNIFPTIFNMYTNKFVIIGSFVYAASMLLWLAVISKIELSYAYPMVSLNFVVIALLSKAFFQEHVSRARWFSIILIVCGVALLSVS